MARSIVGSMRNYLVLVMLCLVIISCERKSGRKPKAQRQYSSTQVKTTNSTKRDVVERPKMSLGKHKTVLTGTAIFEKYNSAVFIVFATDGVKGLQGSGFFISETGLAVSNYHVFKGTTKGLENIKLTDGRILKIKEVIGFDESLDFIVFRVDIGNKRVPHIPICSSSPKIGEKAYAIGSPLGLENTFSSGEISQIRNDNILQISVPIDHGSSGGALINQYGEVIGITTAGLEESSANLNFAMSISVIDRYILK